MLEQAGADVRTQKERNVSDGNGRGVKSPDAHLARQLGGYKSALKSGSPNFYLKMFTDDERRSQRIP